MTAGGRDIEAERDPYRNVNAWLAQNRRDAAKIDRHREVCENPRCICKQ